VWLDAELIKGFMTHGGKMGINHHETKAIDDAEDNLGDGLWLKHRKYKQTREQLSRPLPGWRLDSPQR
jgi:hypothetical protein